MSGPLFRADASDEYFFEEGCFILEQLNDPADPDASIARARLPPGGVTRRHRLAGTTERYVVLEGQGRAEVGDAAPFAIGPGDVVLIPPDVPQRVTNTGEQDLLFLAICTPRFRASCYRNVDEPDHGIG